MRTKSKKMNLVMIHNKPNTSLGYWVSASLVTMIPRRFFSSDVGMIKRFKKQRKNQEMNCRTIKSIHATPLDLGVLGIIATKGNEILYTTSHTYPPQSFVYSLFRLLLPKNKLIHFQIHIENNIDSFFEHLMIKYDSDDLYKKYKYARMTPRRELHTILSKRIVNHHFIQLFCDFFGIHIIVHDTPTRGLKYHFRGRTFDPYTPILFMCVKKGMYYPLRFETRSISTSNTTFHWCVYYHWVQIAILRRGGGCGSGSGGKTISMKKQPKQPKNQNNKRTECMTVKELRDLYDTRQLDVKKTSPITGKRIYKTKKELVHGLREIEGGV